MRKRQLIVFIAVMLIVTAFMYWKRDFFINYGAAAQVWVMVMLVLLTATYVSITRRQADASVKMAEEMRNTRYDALRPIIDIVEMRVEPMELAKQAYGAKEGKFPNGLQCLLRNIGVGPALNVYSFIEDAWGKPCQWEFGAVPVAIGEEEMGCTPEMRLFLEQRDDHRVLVAYYKDVYGNLFESSREVSVDKERDRLEIGPLKIRKLSKEEPTK